MLQVADWLETLGMSEYAQRFAENDIDISVLRHLTDQDLKELGVSLGHRRKMLAAIAELAVGPPAPAQPAPPEAKPLESAERRQVTVLFTDLVGWTALSARTDPEDLRELVSAYQRCVAETVRRFDGFVAKYMGDGALVYFGYPQAHEDDAERAVRAGLALVGALCELKTEAALQTRVGIATGMVVVGDVVGSGDAQERGIVGETPNLAARMQTLAEPNRVVIAEGTRRLLGNLFELEDLGPRVLKGIAGPVRAWAALRASPVASRFEALRTASLTTLVGREEEFELLLRRWARANAGQGQVVLVSGEAGIGKSRLTATLLEHLADEPHARLRYFCSPQHTDSAFHPIIGHAERAAELAHDDAPHEKLDKLDAVLARTATSPEHAALFAELLSLPNDGRYPQLELAPQQRRQKTLEALVTQIEALTKLSPVLIVFEDAHWTDPTSLEVLGRVVGRIAGLRVLLLVTFRPEFEPPWIGEPHVSAVTLNRLAQRDVGAMIDSIIGNHRLAADIRQDIIERTDGIPLFVEEMTKAVLEAESPDEAQRTVAGAPSPAHSVPATLHASLMARLDRLGLAKEVAQIGAAVGRQFSHALLASVMRTPESQLAAALDRLIAAGLLFREGVPPYATYLFKHALVQDAAYGTLLREPRRALHARIAETLEGEFAEMADSRPEALARHCTEAGLIEKAATLWGRAGQRSLERSALVEAAEQLTRALTQLATLPAAPALRREEIRLQVALITPLIHVKGYAAPETKAAAERARLLIEQAEALGEPPEDPLLLFSVLYGVWSANYVAFDGDVLRDLAGKFMAAAEKQGARVALMVGHRLVGNSLMLTGEIAQSRAHFDHALKLYDPAADLPLATRFGQDVGVAILLYRALALWLLGHPDAAQLDAEQAVRDARQIGQAGTSFFALLYATLAHLHARNDAAATALADELVSFADEKGVPFWRAAATALQGCVLAASGKAAEAVRVFSSGMAALRATRTTVFMPLWLSYLSRAQAELGRLDEAWRCIGEALTMVATSKERWWEAEINRVAGELALREPQRNEVQAEASFTRAIAIARAQQARSFELRAAVSLARLLSGQGKRRQARDLLAPIHAGFAEGFDTPDLKEARAVLDELEQTRAGVGGKDEPEASVRR